MHLVFGLWRSASRGKTGGETARENGFLSACPRMPRARVLYLYRTVPRVCKPLRTSVTRGTDIMTRSVTAQTASDYQFSVCWANSTV